MIELELLLGVVEPLEKVDDSFPSFGDVSLTFVWFDPFWKFMGIPKELMMMTNRLNMIDYLIIKFQHQSYLEM